MNKEMFSIDGLDFYELEGRFGIENARDIVRTLEKFEGISEIRAAKLTYAERLRNVMLAMRENMRFQTQH